MLHSDVGMEHPTLKGYSDESSALVVASVFYWELEGYDVEPYPALKEVIFG
jgi:hypothetical protein